MNHLWCDVTPPPDDLSAEVTWHWRASSKTWREEAPQGRVMYDVDVWRCKWCKRCASPAKAHFLHQALLHAAGRWNDGKASVCCSLTSSASTAVARAVNYRGQGTPKHPGLIHAVSVDQGSHDWIAHIQNDRMVARECHHKFGVWTPDGHLSFPLQFKMMRMGGLLRESVIHRERMQELEHRVWTIPVMDIPAQLRVAAAQCDGVETMDWRRAEYALRRWLQQYCASHPTIAAQGAEDPTSLGPLSAV